MTKLNKTKKKLFHTIHFISSTYKIKIFFFFSLPMASPAPNKIGSPLRWSIEIRPWWNSK